MHKNDRTPPELGDVASSYGSRDAKCKGAGISSGIDATAATKRKILALAWVKSRISNNKLLRPFSTGTQKLRASRSGDACYRTFAAVLECRCHAGVRGARPTPSCGLGSIMVSTTSAMLSGEIDLWVHNALRMLLARLHLVLARCVMNSYHVTCQCIVAREGLLLDAQCAPDFLLAAVMDCVLVPSEIIRP
jgi:hypothetical protein